jgi:hypothetical protein
MHLANATLFCCGYERIATQHIKVVFEFVIAVVGFGVVVITLIAMEDKFRDSLGIEETQQ